MPSTTLQPRTMGTAQPAQFGVALGEFGFTLRQLKRTLSSALLRPARPVAAPMNACAEANKVRRLADSYLMCDPGFASDLYAAADRHEMVHGA